MAQSRYPLAFAWRDRGRLWRAQWGQPVFWPGFKLCTSQS